MSAIVVPFPRPPSRKKSDIILILEEISSLAHELGLTRPGGSDLGRTLLREEAPASVHAFPKPDQNSPTPNPTGGALMTLNLSLVFDALRRIDCAIIALGSVMMELNDNPDGGDAAQMQTVRWLYDVLGEEAHNLRISVEMLQPKPANGL